MRRIIATLGIIFFGAIFIGASEEEPESYLLKIELPKRDAIFDLVELKVSILQEFSEYVIAECGKENLDRLKKKDFKYKILDKNPKKNVYYLVLVHYRDDLQILERYGSILNFDGKTAILKITVEDVKGLSTHRFMLKKLRKSPVRIKKKVGLARNASMGVLDVNPSIADMVALVSQGDITTYIQTLQNFTTRYSYTTECENASVYIYNQLNSMGLDVEYQDFGNNMADNVIATQYGIVDPTRIYIICGHYDSTSDDPLNNAPGADDNASGSAAVLEAASILNQYEFNYTIKYICFAGEEQGLHGSEFYAAEAVSGGEDILGVINLDMIGYEDVDPEDLDIFGDSGSEWLVDKFIFAAQTYTSLGTVKTINPNMVWSDHAAFWDEGYSALCGFEDFYFTNPNYHKTLDTIDTLDLSFTEEVTKAAVACLAELAEPFSCGIVLLFDTSGSMAWRHDGTTGVPVEEQRLTLAKQASFPFLEMLNDYNSQKANFGIATFPSHPASNCSAQIVTPMTLVTDSSINTAITTTIPGLITEDNTPLIAGSDVALNMFGWETNKVVILLSDGYHNCPSHVEAADSEFINLVDRFDERSTKAYTIGFARPGDVDQHFLDELATGTGGEFRDVTSDPGFDPLTWDPATDLNGTYKAILADGLSLETPQDPMGIITGNESDIYSVGINEHDKKISFFLSWVTSQMGRLDLRIKCSDGQNIQIPGTGIKHHQGMTYEIITLDRSFLQQPGKVGANPWTIEIKGMELDENEKEHYQYSVITDSNLKMNTKLNTSSYQTGDIITLTARITEGTKPLSGLNDIRVTITGPEDGFGNWFAKNKVSLDEQKKFLQKKGVENLPMVQRKAIYLTDVKKIRVPGRTNPFSFQLYDDGTHGDVKADDGIYTNQFSNTIKEGTYSFYFKCSGQTKQGNPFVREDLIQKYITVNATPNYTDVDVVEMPSSEVMKKIFKVIITPKDVFKNYLGPRYSGAINMSSSHGRFANTIQDNLDGTYSQNLHLDATVDLKDVDIKVNMKESTLSFKLADKIKSPYSLSIYLGGAVPFSSFNSIYNPGFSLGLGFDYNFAPQLFLEGIVGYNNFNSGSALVDDTYWWSLVASLKYELAPQPLRIFISSGSGIYLPKTGSNSFGINIGAGAVLPLNQMFAVEARANYHTIFTKPDRTYFAQIWLGLKFDF